jgi:5'-nucleotidase
MQLVRPRSLSALLTVALGAGVIAGAGTLASPASAEGAAPTGAYALNTVAIWEAQSVQLTQTALADDVDGADAIVREITWGDGTPAQTLATGTTKLRHAYAKAGTYTVSVKLTDSEGNTAPAEITGAAAVKVTVTPGTYKVDKTTGYVWVDRDNNEEGAAKFTVTLTGIPSNTTRVRLNWGDGNFSTLPRTQKTASWYYLRGSYRITAELENSDGKSAARYVGVVKVVEDTFVPTISVKTPKNPTKASSWKTISGTSADKGLGVFRVEVVVWQQRGTIWYYYNFTKKTWIKYKGGNLPSAAVKAINKPAKGAWKVSVAGIKKGLLEVNCAAGDGNGNWSPVKVKAQKIK